MVIYPFAVFSNAKSRNFLLFMSFVILALCRFFIISLFIIFVFNFLLYLLVFLVCHFFLPRNYQCYFCHFLGSCRYRTFLIISVLFLLFLYFSCRFRTSLVVSALLLSFPHFSCHSREGGNPVHKSISHFLTIFSIKKYV